jgi:protease PrsW
MPSFFLLILAVLPGIILLAIILFMDRNEREPLGIVLKVLLLGAASCIPAIIIELVLGVIPIFKIGGFAGAAFISFIQVAPVEEFCKLSVVLLFVWKNNNFNEENDGIVYVGASALGFAIFENIFYVTSGGFSTGIIRALTAMPLHCFTGVLMGYFVGLAKFAGNRKKTKNLIITGFIIAWLIHSVYDTFALSGTEVAVLLIPLVIGLIVFGIIYLQKGHALSIKRSAMKNEIPADENNALIENTGKTVTVSKKSNWKIVLSIILISLSAIFWILLIIGSYNTEMERFTDLKDAVTGGLILTFIPIILGIILLISYIRKKAKLV